jgi:hypothetical protein
MATALCFACTYYTLVNGRTGCLGSKACATITFEGITSKAKFQPSSCFAHELLHRGYGPLFRKMR